MKKLWIRFRDWLIRKLGGFTKKQHDDMWTCLEALQSENRTIRIKNTELESRLRWQRNEILRLNVELTGLQQSLEIKIDDLHIKPFSMKLTHKNEYRRTGDPYLNPSGEKEMKRYMAAKLGQQLLEEGAIKVSEVTDLVSNSVEMRMEVRVVC